MKVAILLYDRMTALDALALVQRTGGDDLAQALQLAIEYDPQPPFDAGSPEKAPPRVVALVRSATEAQLAARRGGAVARLNIPA